MANMSYSWDDEAHKEWVRQLATQLRHDGIDAHLDHWHAVPGDQLPQFMEREIRSNDYVLIVCTPKYKEKSDKRSGGVGYEGDIMTGEVFTTQNHRKFIPVLAKGSWSESAASWLSGKRYIDLSDDARYAPGYEELRKTICGTYAQPPPLGPPPPGYTPPAHSLQPPLGLSRSSQLFFNRLGVFTFLLSLGLIVPYQIVLGHEFGPLLLMVGCVALPLCIGVLLALALRHARRSFSTTISGRLVPILGFKMATKWRPARWLGWFLFLFFPTYVTTHFLLETHKLVMHQDSAPEVGLDRADLPFPKYYFEGRWDLIFGPAPHYWWGENDRYHAYPIVQPWLNVILNCSVIAGGVFYTFCCITGYALRPGRKRLKA
jgi:hypothetical protein